MAGSFRAFWVVLSWTESFAKSLSGAGQERLDGLGRLVPVAGDICHALLIQVFGSQGGLVLRGQVDQRPRNLLGEIALLQRFFHRGQGSLPVQRGGRSGPPLPAAKLIA